MKRRGAALRRIQEHRQSLPKRRGRPPKNS
jgi:hypothetical protein